MQRQHDDRLRCWRLQHRTVHHEPLRRSSPRSATILMHPHDQQRFAKLVSEFIDGCGFVAAAVRDRDWLEWSARPDHRRRAASRGMRPALPLQPRRVRARCRPASASRLARPQSGAPPSWPWLSPGQRQQTRAVTLATVIAAPSPSRCRARIRSMAS
jgi:hypothetical protein